MNSQTLAIRRAVRADAERVACLLADAFADTRVARWLQPHRGARQAAARPYFDEQVDFCLTHGWIDYAPGAGAAMWLPQPGPLPPEADIEQLDAAVGPEVAKRMHDLDSTLHRNRPTIEHHYLSYIGVSPQHQRQGVGTALLTQHHTHLDRFRQPAYLEANDPRSRDLYERLGYTCHDPLTIADGAPLIWPMIRYPSR